MELASVAPYFFTSIVAIATAYFTYKRTLKAQSQQTEVDRQEVLNDAYDSIVEQLRKEISHREALHLEDRKKWLERESELKKKIRELTLELNLLHQKVEDLLERELQNEAKTQEHVEDYSRHLDIDKDDLGSDGAV